MPRQPIHPLDEQQLIQFNDEDMKGSSSVWQAVYVAGRAFLSNRSSATARSDLLAAIVIWKVEKVENRSVFKLGPNRALAWVNALQEELDGRGILDEDDQAIISYIEAANNNILFESLAGATVKYRNAFGDGTQLASSGYSFYCAAEAAAKLAPTYKESPSVMAGIATALIPGDFESLCRQLMSGLSHAEQEIGISRLIDIIGEEIKGQLSSFIPYVGTVKDGVSVITTGIACAQNGWTIYKTNESLRSTRPGNAVKAVDAMLKRDSVELGCQFASASANFAIGVGSTAATFNDAVAIGYKVLDAALALMRTIYNFVRDYIEVSKANEILSSSTVLTNDILLACPFLGAHVIHVAPSSALISHALYSGGVFAPSTTAGQKEIKELTEKISALKVTAMDILSRSRYIVSHGDESRPFDIKRMGAEYVNETYLFGLIKDKYGFPIKSNRLPNNNLYSVVAKRHKQQLAEEKRKVIAGFADKHVLNQQKKKREDLESRLIPFSRQHIEHQRQKKKEDLQNLLTPFTKQHIKNQKTKELEYIAQMKEERDRLIDLVNNQKRIVQQSHQAAQQEEMRYRAQVLNSVKVALDTYDRQITGTWSMFTRQSAESTAAKAYLRSLISKGIANHKDYNHFIETVYWLLGSNGSKPSGLSLPLKENSRLHGLLYESYVSWCR